MDEPGGRLVMNPADEIVAIVDDRNRVVGSAPRWDMRRNRLPHRSTYILVFNSRGDLCVQKRTATKDVFPGYYDIAAGGVVLAGESYEAGARRELAEEVGIRGVPLAHQFVFHYADAYTQVWGSVFSCVYDGDLVLAGNGSGERRLHAGGGRAVARRAGALHAGRPVRAAAVSGDLHRSTVSRRPPHARRIDVNSQGQDLGQLDCATAR